MAKSKSHEHTWQFTSDRQFVNIHTSKKISVADFFRFYWAQHRTGAQQRLVLSPVTLAEENSSFVS